MLTQQLQKYALKAATYLVGDEKFDAGAAGIPGTIVPAAGKPPTVGENAVDITDGTALK
jgi:hypothetical protein